MKDIPRVGFVCTGENALELSGAICCTGKLMKYFNENGYMTGGCYSCISPSRQIKELRERIKNLCACNELVITVGCEGFREGDVMPDIAESISNKTLPFFTLRLSGDEYRSGEGGAIKKCNASRACAVYCAGAIVINLPADSIVALGKLDYLMNSIRSAVSDMGKKAVFKSLDPEYLLADFYSNSSFQE